ncbi:MAG: hypothetical protein ABJB74_12820 [Gemmatimonas sp.]
MSTLLTVLLALSAAGGLAWLVRQFEVGRTIRPTACSRAVDAVFANGTNDTADSVLLKELMVHRDRCQSDAVFVDQARRLMTNMQHIGDARALLEVAELQHAMTPDEFKAQHAWIDAAESHKFWGDGDEGRADELRQRAISAANGLREKWPEWRLPYLILDETRRSGPSSQVEGDTEYSRLEQEARSRKLNGAWFRSLSDWEPIAFTFVVAAIAFLMLAAGLNGYFGAREMSGLATSHIETAKPGYVELKGTLHLLPGTQPVIGPLTKEPVLWYESFYNSGMKNATTRHEQSAQAFVLRDATGEVVVNPTSISVRTHHKSSQLGSGAGLQNNSRLSERRLREGDAAFALGELSVTTDANGASIKHLTIAKDGRQLMVSNYTEGQLISMEKLWFGAGCSVFGAAVLLLAWSFYQRYYPVTAPGIL